MKETSGIPRWIFALVVTPLALLVLLLGYLTVRGLVRVKVTHTTTITHAAVVERVREVAKLVTVEYQMRDVVEYENSWYGSKKKSLVVATGRVLAGIHLGEHAKVEIAESTKTIRIRVPRASIMATEITDLKTYDEKRGWWNPFTPEDRDMVFKEVRVKFGAAAKEMKVRERAEESAKRMLEAMFSRDGYKAEVVFE